MSEKETRKDRGEIISTDTYGFSIEHLSQDIFSELVAQICSC